ncbi:MAG: NAD-dependent DNA ligase LigA [Pirellulaceae bacterium]
MNSPAQRITHLAEQIRLHDRKYYGESRPTISDREYDQLMQELIELERQHPELLMADSPTQRVGGDVQSELKPVRHTVPMMSVDNTYSEQEIRAFDKRVRDALSPEQPTYVLEPKIDGTSLSLRYERGKLVLGATRGRGNVGDDVTVNARTIRSIPLMLPTEGPTPLPRVLEVRGEVYMDNEDFQRVNKELVAAGDEPYANPRNLTSGTLRRLDPKIVAKRRLRFLAHGLGEVEPMSTASYWEWTQNLRQWGLPVPHDVWQAENIDEAIHKIHEFEKLRPKLPYMTDGMVVKVDSFAHRERLGATSKSPRWVVAYKYETEQQPTILQGVRWQVGKGGSLTPVGILEPVTIGGVTVTNVTLHNIEQIQRLGLHLGDTVIVERAGEVIPYVVEAVVDKRPSNAERIRPPIECPSCHTPVVVESPQIYCPNPQCPAQRRERLIWFTGRTQMHIDGLGEKVIDQLMVNKPDLEYADLFRLEVNHLADLTHETTLGAKKATAIVNAIRASRDRWLVLKDDAQAHWQSTPCLDAHLNWLSAPARLGLVGLGEKTVRQLVDSGLVKAPEDIFGLTVESLSRLPRQVRFGEARARKIIKNSNDAKSRGLARVLASLGIRLVGATASRLFADWAGDIAKLSSATLEEVADVLVKNATNTKLSRDKERRVASLLHGELHPREQRELFSEESATTLTPSDLSTAAFLKSREERVSHRDKLGKGRISKLSECFPSALKLYGASSEDIFQCLLTGMAVAQSLFEYLHSPEGSKTIDSLRDVGVDLKAVGARRTESEWSGKAVVITGSFGEFTRDKIKERLISLGAKVSDSVSSRTDLVLVGTEPGSKYDKAVALGVTVQSIDTVRQVMES